MDGPGDVASLVKQLMAGDTPDEQQVLLDALLNGRVSSILEKLDAT